MMTDQLHSIAGAILRPSQPGEKRGMRQVCGVFDAAGQPLPGAMIHGRMGALTLPAPCPDPAHLPTRPGRWLYGGVGYHHFGHALIFSTARLWALDRLDPPPDGILFLDRGVNGRTRPGTTRNLTRLLPALGIDLPVWTIAEPERVEHLLVPSQAISTQAHLFSGTPAYRQFIRHALDRIPTPRTAQERIYISRTKLGFHKAGLMFEDRLEDYLSEAGYRIYHPQDQALDDQIAVYKSASHLIGVDGSALHLAAFAARPDAKVAILARRAFYADAFAAQVRAISGAQAVAISAYTARFAPVSSFSDGMLWFKTLCQTDFAELQRQLAAHGFVAAGADWSSPGPKRIERRLLRAGRKAGEAFVPVPGHLSETG